MMCNNPKLDIVNMNAYEKFRKFKVSNKGQFVSTDKNGAVINTKIPCAGSEVSRIAKLLLYDNAICIMK